MPVGDSPYLYTNAADRRERVVIEDGVIIEDGPSTDANFRRAKVAAGTPPPDWVTSIAKGADYDLWYYPTQLSILIGQVNAAWDTAKEIPQRAADTFEQLGDGGKWIVAGLGLLVILELLKRTR